MRGMTYRTTYFFTISWYENGTQFKLELTERQAKGVDKFIRKVNELRASMLDLTIRSIPTLPK